MTPSYPELADQAPRILAVVVAEEESFAQTLRSRHPAVRDRGRRGHRQRLDACSTAPRRSSCTTPTASRSTSPSRWRPTPGLTVDEDGLPPADDRAAQGGQAGRVRQEGRRHRRLGLPRRCSTARRATTFTGYDRGRPARRPYAGCSSTASACPPPAAGDEVELVLDRTPFYAEAGGQIADAGFIRLAGGALVEVLDVQQPVPGLIVHRGVGPRGRGRRRRPGAGRGRRRAPQVDLPRAHGHPPAAPGAAQGARRDRDPGRLATTRPAGCGSTSPRRPRCVPSVLHDIEDEVNAVLIEDLEVRAFITDPGRGPPDRRDGAVRREVRRPGAGRRGRRLRPRALRRHPRRRRRRSSAWSSCSASPRSAPACAGSRRWSGWTRSATSPASTCWSARSASRSSCTAPRSCPSGSPR